VVGISEGRHDVNSIEARTAAIQRRSLPETPTFLRAAQQQSPKLTPTTVSSHSASTADLEDLNSFYTEITDPPEDPQFNAQATCCNGWRDAINSAREDELKALLFNVVGTLENGLLHTERQTYYHCPASNSCLHHWS